MCNKFNEYKIGIWTYVNVYGDKYTFDEVESLAELREKICKDKASGILTEDEANELLNEIDNDPTIRKKKGLN